MIEPIELSVCIGSACHLRGSYNVIQMFQQQIEEYSLHEKVNFKTNFCMKQCQNNGISVRLNGTQYNVEPEKSKEFFQKNVLTLI